MLKFHHVGIPTERRFAGEIRLADLKLTVSDHRASRYRIQWQRYDADAPYPELVRTVAHAAFEVDDLTRALQGETVIIQPNSPAPGLRVAFIEVDGAPIELMEIDRTVHDDGGDPTDPP